MERKKLKDNWSEIRDEINEWRGDLTNEELDMAAEGNQEQFSAVLQGQYHYTRNLAWRELEKYMASWNSERPGRQNRSEHNFGNLQHSGSNNDDWLETNNREGLSSSRRAKSRAKILDHQDNGFNK
jgi:uncharacterized protein YjbJ (UPF0337 family)